MQEFARLFIFTGVIIAGIGFLILLSEKIGFVGKLPGDILIKRGSFTFYFPIATCIAISIILSIILWLIKR
jgi:hypothetical protein